MPPLSDSVSLQRAMELLESHGLQHHAIECALGESCVHTASTASLAVPTLPDNTFNGVYSQMQCRVTCVTKSPRSFRRRCFNFR